MPLNWLFRCPNWLFNAKVCQGVFTKYAFGIKVGSKKATLPCQSLQGRMDRECKGMDGQGSVKEWMDQGSVKGWRDRECKGMEGQGA